MLNIKIYNTNRQSCQFFVICILCGGPIPLDLKKYHPDTSCEVYDTSVSKHVGVPKCHKCCVTECICWM